MTKVEIDNVTTTDIGKPDGWLNVHMMLKLTKPIKDAKAFTLAMMMITEYMKKGGAPIKGDAASLAAIAHKLESAISS